MTSQFTIDHGNHRIGSLLQWSDPVRIQVGHGLPQFVHGPGEAIEILEHRWPTREGRHYHEALDHCQAAVARLVPLGKAREEFLAACIEADMLAR